MEVSDEDAVAQALQTAGRPMTTPEIVEASGLETRDVDRVLWSAPQQFLWQPGHRWALADRKSRARSGAAAVAGDSRETPLVPRAPTILRAITLASGLVI